MKVDRPTTCELTDLLPRGCITQDIPRLILRMAGELCISFSTGHAQTISLRGEVRFMEWRVLAVTAL